jgi:cytochrome d ubiquinol oxidase subunit I
MNEIISARSLMGISLGVHIAYAILGVGLPLILMIAEWLSLHTGDEVYHQLARRWIHPAGVLFAIGAVSGTILYFELWLLWPRFMEFNVPLIGLTYSKEGVALFATANFLALYTYGEQRLSSRRLFFCTIILTVALAASAIFVISANALMNTPKGFRLVSGALAKVHPLELGSWATVFVVLAVISGITTEVLLWRCRFPWAQSWPHEPSP